jgi:single-stranded DNA-binding protein
MSGYLNKTQLIGNLGADPESRTMQSGGLVGAKAGGISRPVSAARAPSGTAW